MRGCGRTWLAGLGIAGAALLAGCSTTGSAGGANGAGAPAAGPGAAHGAGANGGGAVSNAGGTAAGHGTGASGGRGASSSTARLAPAAQDVVFTSGMTIKVGNAGQAAARAAQIAESAGGYVSQENAALRSSPPGGGTVSIQLKIPVARYAATLTVLGRLGATSSEQQQAQVVTQQVADTASQVTSDQAAIAQLRALERQAGSISELLSIQGRLASQESALEAMQAQQRALDNQTSYGTVTLHLDGPVKAAARARVRRPVRHHHAGGFVGGITGGWKALVAVCGWLLQVIGTVLPIGAALALVGYLAWRSRRRWWPRRQAPPTP
jgi:Domain of unknown function (DUF4349)